MKIKLLQRAKVALGGYELDDIFYRFLRVHTMFLVFSTLASVFINTYIMSQSDDTSLVLYYNSIVFVTCAMAMVVSSRLMRRLNSNLVAVIGIFLYNVLYVTLIALGENAAKYYYVLGILAGVAGGFYWMCYSDLLTDYTQNDNRDKALAIISLSSSAVNLTAPLVSGLIISVIPHMGGYFCVFGLAFVVALLTCFSLARLPKGEQKIKHSKYRQALRMVFTERCWIAGMTAQFFSGVREGTFSFILSVLLYEMVQNEMLTGFNTFLMGAASIGAYILMSKIMRPEKRIKYMLMAETVLIAASLLLVVSMNPVTILLLTIINSFFMGFITNSASCVFFGLVQSMPGARQCRPEIFAIKECFLGSGRGVGVLFVVLVNTLSGDDLLWKALSLLILTLLQFITILVSKISMKMMEKRLQKEETV